MTVEEAEETYMAWQVGFETDRIKIMQALLILSEQGAESHG